MLYDRCWHLPEKRTINNTKKLAMKVVIADDSSPLRERIKSLLIRAESDIIVYEADNGIEALQCIKENQPDLVILDVRMPELNGIEVLKKIRELKIDTRVCMLTNYPFPQYRIKCYELGADYFLDKNMEFKKIADIISHDHC
jgi:DNA-binding NarL/FixJ family response regulator